MTIMARRGRDFCFFSNLHIFDGAPY